MCLYLDIFQKRTESLKLVYVLVHSISSLRRYLDGQAGVKGLHLLVMLVQWCASAAGDSQLKRNGVGRHMEMRAHTHLFVEQFYCGMSTVYEVSDLVAFCLS